MEKTAFLGIDVSKGYADFLLLSPDKTVLEDTFQLEDTASGRKSLGKVVEEWFSSGLGELYCGVESTGGYENNWYYYLKKLSGSFPIKVTRLNARGPKAMGEASLARTVTDAVSADHIASYLIGFRNNLFWAEDWKSDRIFREGRQHNTFVNMLIKQKVQLSNQLEKLVYQHFGEMAIYCRNGMPLWLLRMLALYPGAKQVVKAGARKISGIQGIGYEKAEAVVKKAMGSERTLDELTARTISMTAREVLNKIASVEAEKRYLAKLFGENRNVVLLRTIKGIGLDGAVTMVLEIEDVSRFKSAKALCAYFGVHPTYKQSGDGLWNIKMSKKGRSRIRAMLYMSSLSAIRTEPAIKKLYTRFRGKGMNHYAAMGVVMHKMLRIVYGVLKNRTAYSIDIDRENTEKAETRRKEAEQNKKTVANRKNRYQAISDQAPVSKQKIKKMKQTASQASHPEERTGLPPASFAQI